MPQSLSGKQDFSSTYYSMYVFRYPSENIREGMSISDFLLQGLHHFSNIKPPGSAEIDITRFVNKLEESLPICPRYDRHHTMVCLA